MAEQVGVFSRLAHDWIRILESHRRANSRRAIVELAVTLISFLVGSVVMYTAWARGTLWLYAVAAIPTAGMLVRLFLLQHDCGHHSFFESRAANDALGRLLGVLTLTPYDHWRRTHAIHHATQGNLGRRGTGDVDTLTVAEYLARGRWPRLRYRLYRHPAVMFGIGPLYMFLLQNRVPAGFLAAGWRPWISTMGTNIAALVASIAVIQVVGIGAFVAVQLPVLALAATIGVWLFFVQHQFEHTYWATASDWNVREAALAGSSHYALPGVLAWMTANIGLHHLHHLSSRIPFYRFPDVVQAMPELAAVNRVGLMDGFRCVRLALWDEQARRLVSFREVRERTAGRPGR